MSYLRFEKLTKAFGGVVAVKDVAFDVRKGEIFSIIGPNGAGKTTIFNVLSALYEPTSGRVLFGDRDLTQFKPHQLAGLGIARTFQNIELFDRQTVLENLILSRHSHRATGFWQDMFFTPTARRAEHDYRDKAASVLDFLGLSAFGSRTIGSLSYGIRKLVELARAVCVEPQLLLLDEPSSGLTTQEKSRLAGSIRQLHDEMGITVLMIEHDMRLVSEISDRVVALNYGQVVTVGTPSEVQNHPEVIKAYLGG